MCVCVSCVGVFVAENTGEWLSLRILCQFAPCLYMFIPFIPLFCFIFLFFVLNLCFFFRMPVFYFSIEGFHLKLSTIRGKRKPHREMHRNTSLTVEPHAGSHVTF